jgi:hypothetical protein
MTLILLAAGCWLLAAGCSVAAHLALRFDDYGSQGG